MCLCGRSAPPFMGLAPRVPPAIPGTHPGPESGGCPNPHPILPPWNTVLLLTGHAAPTSLEDMAQNLCLLARDSLPHFCSPCSLTPLPPLPPSPFSVHRQHCSHQCQAPTQSLSQHGLVLLGRLLPGSEHSAHELMLSCVFLVEFLPWVQAWQASTQLFKSCCVYRAALNWEPEDLGLIFFLPWIHTLACLEFPFSLLVK